MVESGNGVTLGTVWLLIVVIHIETVEAVEQLPEMVNVPDIDVIFIGPTDLSHSFGVPGQPQHPSVQAAIDRIIEVVEPTDIALGIMVGNAAAARQWQARGARYITTMLESLLTPAVRTRSVRYKPINSRQEGRAI